MSDKPCELRVEITTAARVGIDGTSVARASIEANRLIFTLSDGRMLDAGALGLTYAGRRIALYGDSIVADYGTAAGTFAAAIRTRFGTNDVVSHGQIGEMLGSLREDWSDSLTDEQQIGYLVARQPDLLIIMAGSGDYWHGVPLGDFDGDIENPEYLRTTTGGLRYLLHHFTKNLTREARMLFATPPPGFYNGVPDTTPNAAGHRMGEYAERLRKICAEYHVPVCDFWSTAGWAAAREAEEPYYTVDGVHLSAAGCDRLAGRLFAEVQRYNYD